jgi:hypothetical protein
MLRNTLNEKYTRTSSIDIDKRADYISNSDKVCPESILQVSEEEKHMPKFDVEMGIIHDRAMVV